MRALNIATKFENLRAKQWPPQLKNSSNNKNTVKSTDFWLSVWKKGCLEKGIAKEIENYEPTQLNTLLERSNAEMKKQTWLNLGNDDSISSKVIRTQTEQFLKLFSRTLHFFCALKTWRYHCILLFWSYAVLTERTVWINYFAVNARAFLMLTYDKLSRIFSCILLV